jgi:hypothetical protein
MDLLFWGADQKQSTPKKAGAPCTYLYGHVFKAINGLGK